MRSFTIFTCLIFAALSSASVLDIRGDKDHEQPCCFEYTSYWTTMGTTVITTYGVASKCVDITIPTCFEKY
jgi:hypothetical protein